MCFCRGLVYALPSRGTCILGTIHGFYSEEWGGIVGDTSTSSIRHALLLEMERIIFDGFFLIFEFLAISTHFS